MIARHALVLGAVCSALVMCGNDAPSGAGTTTDTEMTTTSSTSTGASVDWEVALEVDASVGAFLSVWGVDDDRLYVVGGQEPDGIDDRRFAVGELGTVLHRVGDDDATPWEVGGCETNLALWGVWGASADEVWTVGGDGFSRSPVLYRFDGEAWSVLELPPLSVMSRALFKVWGASADAVWAVGHRGLIVHFDGTQWSEQTSGTSLDLISLWGTAADQILAVGGRSDSVLVRWDGESWQAEESLGAFGLDAVPDVSPTMLALHAVFGVPSGRRFAVGGSLDLSPPFTGVVVAR